MLNQLIKYFKNQPYTAIHSENGVVTVNLADFLGSTAQEFFRSSSYSCLSVIFTVTTDCFEVSIKNDSAEFLKCLNFNLSFFLDLFEDSQRTFEQFMELIKLDCILKTCRAEFFESSEFNDALNRCLRYFLLQNSAFGNVTSQVSVEVDERVLDGACTTYTRLNFQLEDSLGFFNTPLVYAEAVVDHSADDPLFSTFSAIVDGCNQNCFYTAHLLENNHLFNQVTSTLTFLHFNRALRGVAAQTKNQHIPDFLKKLYLDLYGNIKWQKEMEEDYSFTKISTHTVLNSNANTESVFFDLTLLNWAQNQVHYSVYKRTALEDTYSFSQTDSSELLSLLFSNLLEAELTY